MTVSHQTLAPSVEASHNSEIAWGSCRAFRLDFSPLEGISANFEGKKEWRRGRLEPASVLS